MDTKRLDLSEMNEINKIIKSFFNHTIIEN